MSSIALLVSNSQEGNCVAPVPAQSAALFGMYDRLRDGFSPFSDASRPPDGEPGAGLVSLETKRIKEAACKRIPEGFSVSEFAKLGRERRVRRVRRAVSAKASSVRSAVPGGFRWKGAFVTLTYRDLDGWRPDHVRLYCHAVRQYARRHGVVLRYVWVAELQARGAVHYHCVFWWSSRFADFRLPKPDSGGFWSHGSSNIRALRSVGEMYLAKYVSKGDDGAFPKGLRLYGMDRNPVDSLSVHRACLPRWVFNATTGRVDRVPFVGWVSRESGEVLFSLWRLVREKVGTGTCWRFIPAIKRDARCLDCLFHVSAVSPMGRSLPSIFVSIHASS